MTRARRPGFTLLEMMLALGIGLLLLGGLYVGMDVHLEYAQSGRDLVREANVAHAVLNRISQDIQGHVAPVDPRNQPEATASTSTSSTSSSTTTTTEATTTENSTDSAATPTTEEGSSASILGAAVTFNLGIQGEADHLTLASSRLKRSQSPGASDLRRVQYWLIAGKGLARIESTQVTSGDPQQAYLGQNASNIFAPEVAGIRFEYWDGSAWQTSWDGSQLGPDGETPTGPPVAVAVTVTLQRIYKNQPVAEGSVAEYRQVILIPSANNLSTSTTP